MRVLITGGAGFIGHHMIEHILKNTDWKIVTLDRLDSSGTLERLPSMDIWESEKRRVTIVHHDLKAELNNHVRGKIGKVNYILHLAAASHVDRSIKDPLAFVMDNVVGTCNLLNYARDLAMLDLFLYFSTDEVFGTAPEGIEYKEWDRYKSGNPYAATKAGAEELCLAFHNTYKMPIIISHTMNVFGERQAPEKMIPMCIRKIRDNELIQVHADKTLTKAGSRFYIHARNVADSTLFVLSKGESGEKYNIVGELEIDNEELVWKISNIMQKTPKYELVDFHSSRPGHDLRYALDGRRMTTMGWKLLVDFEDSLTKTVGWYLRHQEWL